MNLEGWNYGDYYMLHSIQRFLERSNLQLPSPAIVSVTFELHTFPCSRYFLFLPWYLNMMELMHTMQRNKKH